MNTRHDSISDAELHAFIDNELDEERRQYLTEMLKENRTLRNRVQQYQMIDKGLRAGKLLDDQQPIPDRLLQAAIAVEPRRPVRRLVAAGLLIMGVLGGFVGGLSMQLATSPSSSPQQYIHDDLLLPASLAYKTYVPEIRHPVDVDGSEQQHLVDWLSNRLQHRIQAPVLESQGFYLVGGRLLPAGEQAAALLMYENDQGKRLTVYVRRLSVAGENTAFSISNVTLIPTFYWIDQYYGYALSADMSREQLLALGRNIYSQLTR